MGEVQAELESELPQLLVPNARDSEPLALHPFHLRNDSNTRSLAMSVNQTSYFALGDYPGSNTFLKEAELTITRALELMEIDTLNRVAYRYDNAIPLAGEAGEELPLEHLINLSDSGWLGTTSFTKLSVDWERKWQSGRLGGRIFQESKEYGQCVRMILFATVDPAGSREKLGEFASKAHAQALLLFEDIITNSFREFLKLTPPEIK